MQNKLNLIAGGLLGLLFIFFGLNFFFHLVPMPPPLEGSPAAVFMTTVYTTGFLAFVKVLEILGGILVIPTKTRKVGLLILVPILVNILAFHVFISTGGLFQPPVILITLLVGFLLCTERSIFRSLLNHNPASTHSNSEI